MSFISSYNIISVISDLNITLLIPPLAAEAAAVNPNGTNRLLANGVSKFFISDRPAFISYPRSLPRNPPDCIIGDN